MNQELFAKIAEVINDRPHEFDMHSWENDRDPVCGTTRCVAGWAIHFETGGQPLYARLADGLNGISLPVRKLADRLGELVDFRDLGARLLDIDDGDASILFYADNERARQVVDLFAHGYEAEGTDLLRSEE